MTSLMPRMKDISAFRAPPVPNVFNEEAFLGILAIHFYYIFNHIKYFFIHKSIKATLELSGPQLTSNIKGI